MKRMFCTCAALLLHALTLVALSTDENICVVQPQAVVWNGQQGGLYLPSHGHVHGLVIFAQFPDDSLDINHPDWPKNQPPRQMGEWVDSVWTGNPTPYSMTDYFNQMSLGKFRFTAKKRFVVAPRTRQQYRTLGLKRGDIHREIIQILDSTMDFSEFDRWDPEAPYVQIERQDKIVDFVMVVWRNIHDEGSNAYKDTIKQELNFTYDQTDLGFSGLIPVDVGAGDYRVPTGSGMNGNTPEGVAITIRKTFTRAPFMSEMQTCVHEVGHALIEYNRCHVGFGFWGMVSAYGIRNFTANSFERHRLGWINLIPLEANSAPIAGATLPDYVTTGVAYTYIIDSASYQFFYIENHQSISRWDQNNNGAPLEKGVYVLRQDKLWGSPAGDFSQMRMIPADGLYDWTVTRRETNSCCGATSLAVFKQLAPNRHNGWHDCDKIPYVDPVTQQNKTDDILLMEDAAGNTMLVTKFAGDGQDAFRMGYQQVFSPWSNPTSQNKDRTSTGFGFELTGVTATANGDVYTLNFHPQNPVDASPAKIQAFVVTPNQDNAVLSWQPNEESDLKWYNIYRTGIVNLATVPSDNAFQLLVTLNAKNNGSPVTNWTDTTAVPVTTQPNNDGYYYKITAIDSTNKESVRVLTRVYINSTISTPPGGSGKRGTETGNPVVQLSVVPNPSADVFWFTFSLPEAGQVLLQVIDGTGRTIATVADRVLENGEHTLQFDGAHLSKGLYFYQLTTAAGSISGTLVVQ